jgi:hypothetical protein
MDRVVPHFATLMTGYRSEIVARHERSDMREASCAHHALVMLQIADDAFISRALSLEPGRFA